MFTIPSPAVVQITGYGSITYSKKTQTRRKRKGIGSYGTDEQ